MKIVSVYFDEKPIYRTLRRIYENSLRAVMPDIESVILEPGKQNREHYSHKLDTAAGFIAAANYVVQQEEICAVVDIDILWRKRIDDLWMGQYDLAVTVRETKAKYNTGLWIYTPHARKAVTIWKLYTKYYADNLTRLHDEIWSWGGIDQIALRDTIKECPELKVIELPCQEWNAEQSTWHRVNEKTRLIHLKSKLRQEIQGKKSGDPVIARLAKLALKFDREGNSEKKKN